MIIISHRGNLTGPAKVRENNPVAIREVIDLGFDVEVDVWCNEHGCFLGHDDPMYDFDIEKFDATHTWVHAKNLEAASQLVTKPYINSFSHDKDNAVYTSHGWLWVHPKAIWDMPRVKLHKTIAVLPELYNIRASVLKNFAGVCTDYPIQYRDLLGE